MGNTQDNPEDQQDKNEHLVNLLTESKKFIAGDKTPFQFIQNAYEHQHIKMKETSDLTTHLTSRSIVDFALNIYSDIFPFRSRLNSSLYLPCSIMKYNHNGDKDIINFFSMQVLYMNDLVSKHAELLEKDEMKRGGEVPSIRIEEEEQNKLRHTGVVKHLTQNKIGIKKKSIDEMIVKQYSSDKKALLLTPDIYISRNDSSNKEKMIKSSSNLKTHTMPLSFGLGAQIKQGNHQSELSQEHNNVIDAKYQQFLLSVINNLPPPSNEAIQLRGVMPKTPGEKPPYTITVTDRAKTPIKETLQKRHTRNSTQCKRYFKSKKEIEEEEILKKYFSPLKGTAKSIKLKIDIRSIPQMTNGLNDSSDLSNENYNFFMHPHLKPNESTKAPSKPINSANFNEIISIPTDEHQSKEKSPVQLTLNDLDKSFHLIHKRRTAANISLKNMDKEAFIGNDSTIKGYHRHKQQNKTIASIHQAQSKNEGSFNGRIVDFNGNAYRKKQLKKANQKKYEEIIAQLNLPCYKIDCEPLEMVRGNMQPFDITEALAQYKQKNKFLFEFTEEERKLEEKMK